MASLVLGWILVGLGAPVLVLGLLLVDPDEGWSFPTFAIAMGLLWLLAGLVLVLASLIFRRHRDGGQPETPAASRRRP